MKHLLLLLFTTLCLFTACRSPKSLTKSPNLQHHTSVERFARKVEAQSQTALCVTSRVKVGLNLNGKNINCGGSLKMKRNDVIQLSLTFLGFEVGRMQFTPEEVLIIDKINKQYVRGNYGQVAFLRQAHLDFYALQALFWHELFIPGQQVQTWSAKDYDQFRMSQSGAHTLLLLSNMPELDYQFLTQTATGNLDRVTIRSKSATRNGELVWTYGNFTSLDGKPFPKEMNLSMKGLGKNIGLQLTLSSPNNNDNWETRTNLKSSYQERNIDDIFEQLMNMSF